MRTPPKPELIMSWLGTIILARQYCFNRKVGSMCTGDYDDQLTDEQIMSIPIYTVDVPAVDATLNVTREPIVQRIMIKYATTVIKDSTALHGTNVDVCKAVRAFKFNWSSIAVHQVAKARIPPFCRMKWMPWSFEITVLAQSMKAVPRLDIFLRPMGSYRRSSDIRADGKVAWVFNLDEEDRHFVSCDEKVTTNPLRVLWTTCVFNPPAGHTESTIALVMSVMAAKDVLRNGSGFRDD
ncbi:hypothetical protein EDB19DRAFT_2024603 [Suillus lakei]|nr:hypothetical protein EDB19DRAFT_2024603 [Suillus lakei]